MVINGDGNELLWEEEFKNSDTNSVTGSMDAVFEGLVAEVQKSYINLLV